MYIREATAPKVNNVTDMVLWYAGVDLPSRREFVAHTLTEEQVCEVLGADGLVYQTIEDLLETGYEMNPEIKAFDASCFDGIYVSGDIDEEYLSVLESKGRGGRTATKKHSMVTV